MHIFQVAEFIAYFNDAVRSFMNEQQMAIEGEVAEYKVSQQRFVWFKLKDPKVEGVLDCFAMLFTLKVPLEDGMRVRLSGYPKIFPRSGKLSINVSSVELVGEGALKRAFELLKKQLAEEGLFSTERKRAIPRIPERVALITSRDAAAYTDFLRILQNRWGGLQIDLAHVVVQGRDAERDIVGAFRHFNAHAADYDVLVLTRGGGSMEDLAAFNSEAVARAIFSSKIPVVVGVGHERDETIADYVADVRASTPTNAAERIVPDRRDVAFALSSQARMITQGFERVLHGQESRLGEHVGLLARAIQAAAGRVGDVVHRFFVAGAHFSARVRERRIAVGVLSQHMAAGINHHGSRQRERLFSQSRLLGSLDPKAVLRRGYAIVFGAKAGVVKDPAQVDAGSNIRIQLAGGSLDATVGKYRQPALPL